MTDRELMQQALEVLELVTELTNHDDAVYAAIDALRERLAQPEQALVIDCPRCGHCCSQHKPLTDDEINNLQLPPSGTATVRDLVRLIEAAHNIKKQDEMPLFDDWDKDWK